MLVLFFSSFFFFLLFITLRSMIHMFFLCYFTTNVYITTHEMRVFSLVFLGSKDSNIYTTKKKKR